MRCVSVAGKGGDRRNRCQSVTVCGGFVEAKFRAVHLKTRTGYLVLVLLSHLSYISFLFHGNPESPAVHFHSHAPSLGWLEFSTRYMNKVDFSTISTDRLLLRFVRKSQRILHQP